MLFSHIQLLAWCREPGESDLTRVEFSTGEYKVGRASHRVEAICNGVIIIMNPVMYTSLGESEDFGGEEHWRSGLDKKKLLKPWF